MPPDVLHITPRAVRRYDAVQIVRDLCTEGTNENCRGRLDAVGTSWYKGAYEQNTYSTQPIPG